MSVPVSVNSPGEVWVRASTSRAQIDARFASNQDLGRVLEQVARLSVRLVMSGALAAEVTEFLGRDRDQRGQQARLGSRSGHGELHVSTIAGPVVLERPRLHGTTEPVASRRLGKGVSHTNAPESLVLSGFMGGLPVRGVEAAADGHCDATHGR